MKLLSRAFYATLSDVFKKKAETLIMKPALPLPLPISCDACGNFQVVG